MRLDKYMVERNGHGFIIQGRMPDGRRVASFPTTSSRLWRLLSPYLVGSGINAIRKYKATA